MVGGDGLAEGDVGGRVQEPDVHAAVVQVPAGEDRHPVPGGLPLTAGDVDAAGTAVTRDVVGRRAAAGDVLEQGGDRAAVGGVGARLVAEGVLDVHRLGRGPRGRLVHHVVDGAPLVRGTDQIRVGAPQIDRGALHPRSHEALGPPWTQAVVPCRRREDDVVQVDVVDAHRRAVLVHDVEAGGLEPEGAGRSRHAGPGRAHHLSTGPEREGTSRNVVVMVSPPPGGALRNGSQATAPSITTLRTVTVIRSGTRRMTGLPFVAGVIAGR